MMIRILAVYYMILSFTLQRLTGFYLILVYLFIFAACEPNDAKCFFGCGYYISAITVPLLLLQMRVIKLDQSNIVICERLLQREMKQWSLHCWIIWGPRRR